MNMELDPHVRAAFDEIVAQTPDIGPAPSATDAIPNADPGRSGRRGWLAVAAVAAVTIAGLVVISTRDDASAPASQPVTPDPSAVTAPPAPAAMPAFVFETPTVRLQADTVEVVTDAGTFVPPDDVVVEGDPGMPEQYTTLELTWHDGPEQRIYLYFRSDGETWWVDEIRTYDGTRREEWVEPTATGRFFETPLGSPYVGDVDLPNLHITGMTLEAFGSPDVCDAPTEPRALVADYPIIRGWAPGGYGASFQVYETANCVPLPINAFEFTYSVDDPAVAVTTDQELPVSSTPTLAETGSPLPPSQYQFDDIKSRVGLDFTGPGSTTLRISVTDQDGTVIDTAEVPIVVTNMDSEGATADTTVPPQTVPSADIDALLTDVPLPDGFDSDTIVIDAIHDRYQVVWRVSSAVTCAWLDQWFTGQETGDQDLSDGAAAALATSHDWAMLHEISDQGDFPLVVWQHADAVNGGEGVLTGAGPQPPSRREANASLDCDI